MQVLQQEAISTSIVMVDANCIMIMSYYVHINWISKRWNLYLKLSMSSYSRRWYFDAGKKAWVNALALEP